jgi:outer membrane autotransporter protein
LFDGALRPFAEVSLTGEFLGGRGVSMEDATVRLTGETPALALSVGSDLVLGSNFSAFAEVRNVGDSVNDDTTIAAQSGLRLTW